MLWRCTGNVRRGGWAVCTSIWYWHFLFIYKLYIGTPCHIWHASIPLLTAELCSAFALWSRLEASWKFSSLWLSEWSHVLCCRGYNHPWSKLKSLKRCVILSWSIRPTPSPNTWVADRRENSRLALQLLGTLGYVTTHSYTKYLIPTESFLRSQWLFGW